MNWMILVPLICRALVGSQVLSNIRERVLRWETVEVAGLEKQKGVLKDLRVIGVKHASWLLCAVISLVVVELRRKAGEPEVIE